MRPSFRVTPVSCGRLLLLLLCSTAAQVLAGEMRVWKAAEGPFKVEAALTQQSETHVKLKKKDGTELVVPRDKLSKEDLDYLLFADPPLPAHAAKGKQAAPSKPASVATPPESAPSSSDRPKPAVTKPSVSKLKGDTFESIRQSFDKSFESLENPGKLPVLPVSPGTNFEALVKDLSQPLPAPTFVEHAKATVELSQATEKNWLERTCLAAGGIYLLEYDESGQRLVVWHTETGKQVCAWKCGELANARCFAISPSGKYLAVGRTDNSIEVYDPIANKNVRTVKVNQKEGTVFRVAFNWEEKNVYVLTDNANSLIFSLTGGPDLGGSLHDFLPSNVHSDQKPFKFDSQQNKIEFAISATGRAGVHINEKLHLSFDASNSPRPLLYKTTMSFHPVAPVRNGCFSRVSKIAIHTKVLPSAPGIGGKNDVERAGYTFSETDRFSLDHDERSAWNSYLESDAWVVEIVDLNYAKRSHRVVLPNTGDAVSADDRHWTSSELQRVIRWSPKTKQLTVYRLQDYVEPASWRLYSLVMQAFFEKRYDFLEGLFVELGKLDKPFHGSEGELPLEEALFALSVKNLYVHQQICHTLIEDWFKARPQAIAPRLLIAYQVLAEGGMARGSGAAGTVSPQGMQTYAKAGVLADKMLEPVMAQAKPPAYAFSMQHSIAKMTRRSVEDQAVIAARVIKLYPTCWQFHSGMAYNLLPRWHGEQGDSVAYAESIAKKLGGDSGDIAYGMMGSSLMTLHKAEEFVAATQFEPARITRGLIKAALLNPDDARPFFRLLNWVYYTRYFDPQSKILDPNMDEKLSTEYRAALTKFDRLTQRHDWTLYEMPKEALAEYSIFKSNSPEPPAKPRITRLPIAM